MPDDDGRAKSKIRFKQINHLVDNMLRFMPTPTHALVMIVAWRDADTKGRFSMSYSQIAGVVGVSRRHVLKVVNDLLEQGFLKVIRAKAGRRPPVYRIVFEKPVVVKCGSPQELTRTPVE